VEHQGRHIELFQILREVGLGKRLDGLVRVLEAGLHAPEPELVEHPLRDLGPRPVGAVELDGQVLVELRPVLEQARPETVEHFDGQALRIGRSLDHDRRHRGDQDGFGHPRRPVATDVPGDFSAPGGVAHQRHVIQIEGLDDRGQIVGVAVHVVARECLAGSAMAAPVVRDRPETVLRQEQQLPVPGIGVERQPWEKVTGGPSPHAL